MSPKRPLTRRVLPAVGLSGALVAGLLSSADASSHREAPLITEDPVADLTDVYAFVSPDRPDSVTFIANVIPFETPAGGPNFHKFGDDVLYSINVDSDGNALPDTTYEFRFTTTVANGGTFLYNTNQVTSLDDPDLNVKQTYSVTEVRPDAKRSKDRRKVLATNVPVAPANVGVRSTPDYEKNLGSQAAMHIGAGINVFAGPRDDPFFVDLGSIFDLGGLRPFNTAHLVPLPTEAGKDYVAGYNVHSIAIQIPTDRLVENGDPVLGVWATTSRRSERVLKSNGVLKHRGNWVQVSRLGMPLVNEVVVPVGAKDKFNASRPYDDAQFAASVLNPELANLIPVLYPGVTVPTSVDAGLGLGGREDIATIFLTGIPGVNKPAHVRPSEMLRLNTSVAKSSFPNGRALADDVTDIEIRALAGATAFTPDFNKAPNNALGDGVDANDKPFTNLFPYLAAPASGY
ncbi:MAG: DUF4331 domain-containing protein [Acidimicrobiia bacterium]